ncbi:MAG: rod shape-determining protein MreC [Elusimicrobiota bacterium]
MTRDTRGANILLLVFASVSLLLLSLPLTAKVHAVRACLGYLLNPVPYYGSEAVERLAGLPAGAVRLISQDLEFEQLRKESQERALLVGEIESLRHENARLLTALGMKLQAGRIVRWSRVMERDPIHWHRSVMVDSGSEDGVSLNAPVVGIQGTELGVIGRVIEVGARTSKVLLLTDELSAAAGTIQGTEWEGLVQGQGSARMRMDYLPVDAVPQTGVLVHTSPTSATFPPGLLVGTVTQVFTRDPFLAFQSVEVTPAVHLSAIKELMILVPERSAQP